MQNKIVQSWITLKEKEIAHLEKQRKQINKMEYVGEFTITYYCNELYPHICGGSGITASGFVAQEGITVAADPSVIPLGTPLYIDGIGVRFTQDTGSAVNGNRIDVLVATHEEALELGVCRNVQVWEIH